MPVYKSIEINDGGKISIWHITESKEDLLKPFLQNKSIIEELNTIKNERKKIEYLASRNLLKFLCDEFNICKYEILKDLHGKPYLPDNEVNISISHSFDYCAVMFHPLKNVGLDIQKVEDKLIPLSSKFLTEREVQMLGGDLRQTCVVWSAKEAAYKHTGIKGLSMKNNFHIVELPADSSLIIKYIMENDEAFFLNTSYEFFDNYVVAYIAE